MTSPRTLGIPDRKGAIVQQVAENGPAAKAGVRAGDIIVEFNGRKVENDRALVEMVVATRPGTTVPVKLVRDKQHKSLNLTVAELDLERETGPVEEEPTDLTRGFGLTLDDLTPAIARRLRLPAGTSGALVSAVRPRSPAERAGLRENDVIIRVGSTDVEDADAAAQEFQRVAAGRAVGVYVVRNGNEVFVTMRRGE